MTFKWIEGPEKWRDKKICLGNDSDDVDASAFQSVITSFNYTQQHSHHKARSPKILKFMSWCFLIHQTCVYFYHSFDEVSRRWIKMCWLLNDDFYDAERKVDKWKQAFERQPNEYSRRYGFLSSTECSISFSPLSPNSHEILINSTETRVNGF